MQFSENVTVILHRRVSVNFTYAPVVTEFHCTMEFSGNDELSISAPVFESIDSIKVLVRVRPLSEKEVNEENESVVDILNDQTLRVTSLDGKRSFQCAFDAVLGPSASQAQVYDIVKSCTHSVLDGFNSTVFAYGQTGSGKVSENSSLFISLYLV